MIASTAIFVITDSCNLYPPFPNSLNVLWSNGLCLTFLAIVCFRPNTAQFHSTETAVLSVHNDLVRAVDDNQVTILVMLDLSAVFDTVDQNVLLSMLSSRFNVPGKKSV